MKKDENAISPPTEAEARLYIVGWILWFAAMLSLIFYALWLRD